MALWLAKNWLPLQRHQQRTCGSRDRTCVVISKKLITFAETSTACLELEQLMRKLWLAKNWLPLQRHQQLVFEYACSQSVVISKKLITFAETSTAIFCTCSVLFLLWLAKNWLPLQRHQQQAVAVVTKRIVVISKKLITFAETSTAPWLGVLLTTQLWLAKNWLPLQRHQQRGRPLYRVSA